MRAYAHTLAKAEIRQRYVRHTFVYVPNTLTYVGVRCVIRRDQLIFLDIFKIYQRMRAYRIYVIHTLAIRTAYAGYDRHTLNTQEVRYSCVVKTLFIHL